MKKLIFILLVLPLFVFSQAKTTGFKDSVLVGTTIQGIQMDSSKGVVLKGNATCYDDLFFPTSLSNQAVINYPLFVLDSNYYTYYIDTTNAGTKCITYYIVQMPHKWKEGSKIYPHFHYKHTTAQGTPTIKVKYKWYNIGSTINEGWRWLNMSTTTGTTNLSHQIAYSTLGITATGKTISSILLMEVYLGATTGATKTCFGYQFDIHYEVDGFGSKTEYTK